MNFDLLLEKLFGKKQKIDYILITEQTLLDVCHLAGETHPLEFFCFLEGKIENNKIILDGMIFQPYYASNDSAMPKIDLPTYNRVLGSLHSHPSKSNSPSTADKRFFHKTGIVHGIIKYPYRPDDLSMFDINGHRLAFKVLKYVSSKEMAQLRKEGKAK